MKGLNEVKWKDFRIEDVFEIKPGIRLTKDSMLEGRTPFIGATDSNNGITTFCGNSNKSQDSNVLGVNYNGSVVENFYHPYTALFSDDVKHLKLKGREGNKYIYLFLKNVILKQKQKFQYGYKFNGERMRRQTIVIPITESGAPDYYFMEQYMKDIEKKLLTRYQSYLAQKKDNLLSNLTGEVKWKAFKIDELFSIKATKSSIDRKVLEGGTGPIPYVTRTDKNNGIDSFIEEQNNFSKDEQNVITVGLDTQTAFYQSNAFYTGQNIQVFRNNHLNRDIALFILPLLKKQFGKFNWGGNGATLGRLRKLSIVLPATPSGQPDYAYMESYMENKKCELLHRYVAYRFNI